MIEWSRLVRATLYAGLLRRQVRLGGGHALRGQAGGGHARCRSRCRRASRPCGACSTRAKSLAVCSPVGLRLLERRHCAAASEARDCACCASERLAIEAREDLPGLDDVVVVDEHGGDAAADLGADLHRGHGLDVAGRADLANDVAQRGRLGAEAPREGNGPGTQRQPERDQPRDHDETEQTPQHPPATLPFRLGIDELGKAAPLRGLWLRLDRGVGVEVEGQGHSTRAARQVPCAGVGKIA